MPKHFASLCVHHSWHRVITCRPWHSQPGLRGGRCTLPFLLGREDFPYYHMALLPLLYFWHQVGLAYEVRDVCHPPASALRDYFCLPSYTCIIRRKAFSRQFLLPPPLPPAPRVGARMITPGAHLTQHVAGISPVLQLEAAHPAEFILHHQPGQTHTCQ